MTRRVVKIFRNFLVKLLVLSGSLVASALLLEFSLRALMPVYDPRGMLGLQYYSDGDILLCPKNFSGRMWKNTGDYNVAVSINKYGFRDKKDLASSAPGDFFVLGDSYGLGWGVEEENRCSDLLESTLGVPVYNISTPAGDINNYQKLLNYAQAKGARISNLIVTICMENDLRDYAGQPKHYRKLTRRIDFHTRPMGIKAWLEKNSATYQAAAAVIHQNSTLKKMAVTAGVIKDNYSGMRKNTYSDKIITSTARRILELSAPFNTAIVIIPSRALWVGENRYAELAAHNELVSSLEESGASVVDLRPYFEEGGNPLQYYFRNDGHWNERGHRKAAEAIRGMLTKNRALYNLPKNRYN